MKTLFAFVPEIHPQGVEREKPYREFLRVPSMSAGVYILSPGTIDAQQPHHEDEVYYVIRGRAHFTVGVEDHEVSAGSVIFVAAEVGHRFHDITEELAVLVLFAPAET